MLPKAQQQVTPRFDTIDLLRGFSILSVILLHISNFLGGAGHPIGQSFPRWLRYVVFNNGGNGVSVFFAISGFLITFISIRRFGSLGAMKVRAFYRIRFARIAPPFASLLLVLSVLHLASAPYFRIRPSVGTLPQALFAAVTFHLNWFEAVHGFLPANWTVLWSLSVEEMFYLFFPILCWVCLRTRFGFYCFLAMLAGLVIFGPFARTPWYTQSNVWGYQSYLGNMDNVALGCLFAMLTHRFLADSQFARTAWLRVAEWVGTAMILFIVFWMWPQVVFGWHVKRAMGHSGTDVTVLGLGTCLVMFGSTLRQARGNNWTAPVRWLGRYSYEVYLSHQFAVFLVLTLFLRVQRGPVALWVTAVLALSGVLGLLLAHLVSEPANRALRGAPTPPELRLKPQEGSD